MAPSLPSEPRIVPLARARLDEVGVVLAEAFLDYPVMRFVLADAGQAYRRHLGRLVEFFALARFHRDDLVFGVESPDGGLVAVALLNRPGSRPSPPALGTAREALWAELGADARARYEAFGRATSTFAFPEPHHHLAMVGSRPAAAGMGHGRRLLEQVHEIVAQDPTSRGVSLTTEDPGNVALYRKFGYEVIGHERAGPLETWGFWRPTR